jgi:hypothetical protein
MVKLRLAGQRCTVGEERRGERGLQNGSGSCDRGRGFSSPAGRGLPAQTRLALTREFARVVTRWCFENDTTWHDGLDKNGRPGVY